MTQSSIERLPALTVNTLQGDINLAELKGLVVLYFYPKDSTPGCTIQANDFRDLYDAFVAQHVLILGVSRDTLGSHKKFCDSERIPFNLISDKDQTLCQYYDVIKPKMMYGKQVTGIERSTFLYRDGMLIEAWRKVKPEGHAHMLLDYIRKLTA